ncbi:MAG: hypothetical protein KTR30_02515 [Saprospiraceae bacterium]|nr:hypothetical protein [Saprospiraceae bacterium]
MKYCLLVALFLLSLHQLHAQSSGIDIPKEISFPTTASYDRAEPTVKACMQWLLKNPIDTDPAEHKRLAPYVFRWLEGTDKVSVAIDADLMKYTDKNSRLIMVFLSGWALYQLEHGTSNEAAAREAGVVALITSYSDAQEKEKDKDIEKLIKQRRKTKKK